MIIIEKTPKIDAPDQHYAFAYCAIARAIHGRKIEAMWWNSEEKNIYDVYDEINPEIIIYHTNLHKQIDKLGIKSFDFNSYYHAINSPLISDSELYRKLNPEDSLRCEAVCISPYQELENWNNFFLHHMDTKVKNFRYFGYKRFGGHKDCGIIEQGLHSLLLSSSDKVVVLSDHFAVNAVLCNQNIVGSYVSISDAERYSATKLSETII